MFDNRIPPAGFTYADYRNGGVKFWNYELAPNPNAGGALRPQPCEDAPGYLVDPAAVPSRWTRPRGMRMKSPASATAESRPPGPYSTTADPDTT
jgi:hypothetical protein